LIFIVIRLRGKRARSGAILPAALLAAGLFSLCIPKTLEAKDRSVQDGSKKYVCMEMPAHEKSGPYASFRMGAGLWRPSMGIQVSAGWAWKKWLLGYVMEWNPWIAMERIGTAPGTYVTGLELAYMYPVNLRMSLRFGMVQGFGVLLFDPYGHHQGEIGPYSAYRIMGLDIKVSRRVVVMIDPVDMSVVVINPVKLPLLYQQWRFSLAVRFK
jgi:hypothetical protein